jgi:2-keto-4-pentenoate hydratase
MRRFHWALLPLLCSAGCVGRGDPAARMAEAFLAREPIGVLPPGLTLDAAYVIQDAYVHDLARTLGPVVGYKAGLTSPETQQRFGVTHPLYGVLLKEMLLPSGSVLPARFGVRPFFEGDLIVRVGSDAITSAETDEDLLATLDAVVPFLELPDLMVSPETPLDGPVLAAINVGGRLGIVGEPVPFPDSAAYVWLGAIRLQVVGAKEQVLAEGRSDALMGHPLNVVRWLRDALRDAGMPLEHGMLLSLGTVTPLMPPEAGQNLGVRYEGLKEGGPEEIRVSFR